MCLWSKYSTFNSFDLQSSWMSIIVPSGETQYKAHEQGHIQGLCLIHIIPLIWIKISVASCLTASNRSDVLLKQGSSCEVKEPLFINMDCVLRPVTVGLPLMSLSLSNSGTCSFLWSNINVLLDHLP